MRRKKRRRARRNPLSTGEKVVIGAAVVGVVGLAYYLYTRSAAAQTTKVAAGTVNGAVNGGLSPGALTPGGTTTTSNSTKPALTA
jgi:hypothetical protein